MHDSLLRFALKASPGMRKAEATALDQQREAKAQKKALLRKKKLLAAESRYATALTYIEMYYSPAAWKTSTQARGEFNKLTSNTAKLNAVKEQIRIRVLGFGWSNLHHPWSEGGIYFTPEDLLQYLIKTIIAEEKKLSIPKTPTMEIPSRKHTMQLGTCTSDVATLDKRYEAEKKDLLLPPGN